MAISVGIVLSYIRITIQSSQIKIEFRFASFWAAGKDGTSQTLSELLAVVLRAQIARILHQALIGQGQALRILRCRPDLILIV